MNDIPSNEYPFKQQINIGFDEEKNAKSCFQRRKRGRSGLVNVVLLPTKC